MKTLVQLKEIPIKEFSFLERFQNFDNTLELNKLLMVILIGFSVIFITGISLYILSYYKNNFKVVGRVIVISSIICFVTILNIYGKYLPINNYNLVVYDYQESDKLFENIENPYEKYIYRDGFKKVNGTNLETVSEDTTEIYIYKN